MLIRTGPKSARQRQAEFLARNPGYDARRKRIARQSAKRDAALGEADFQKRLAAVLAERERKPLLLPAPVEPMPLLIGQPETREAVPVLRAADAA